MKTKITIVDPFKGTVVVESDGSVEVNVGSSYTSVKVDGIEVVGEEVVPTTTGTAEPITPRPPTPEEEEKLADWASKELTKDEPLTLDRPAGRKQSEKTCAHCGDKFMGHNRAKYCEKHRDPAARTETKTERHDPYKTHDMGAGPAGPQPEGHWWCLHHKSWQTHKTPECPKLDEEDKSPAERANEAAKAAGVGPEFTDPWNCGRCRTEAKLCRMHRSMAASGQQPPANIRSL